MTMTIKLQAAFTDAWVGRGWTYDFAKDRVDGIVPVPTGLGTTTGNADWPDPRSLRLETFTSYEQSTFPEAPSYFIYRGEIVVRRSVTEQTLDPVTGKYRTSFEQSLDPTKTTLTNISRSYFDKYPLYNVSFDKGEMLKLLSGKTFGQLIKDGTKIYGGAANDRLKMTNASEKVYGGAGNDNLVGRGGDDVLSGDGGSDKLKGGTGADTFLYRAVSDSTLKSRDVIYDFSKSDGDTINLKAIDAKGGTPKNDKFKFIGKKAFTGNAGELRFETAKKKTYVYGDVDGDRKADFAILLKGELALEKADFLL